MQSVGRICGGVLLIVGTALGGGMLALPMATAAAGYLPAFGLFVAIWLLTLIASFYILEANCYLPAGAHFISMARQTLGRVGATVTTALIFIFLYTLLSGYTAGGSDLANTLLHWLHFSWAPQLGTVLFVLVFAVVLYLGVLTVDWVNRGLMLVKFGAYFLLIVLMLPHVHTIIHARHSIVHIPAAILIVLTAFGFGGIIPSIRQYFQTDIPALRVTIVVGSLVPLVCYLLWNLCVQGSIQAQGATGLIAMAHAPNAVSQLTEQLAQRYQGSPVASIVDWFTSICVTTSFLGVSLGLFDLVADTCGLAKRGLDGVKVLLLTLLPPLLIVILAPGIFMQALSYAGALCVVLLILLPTLMVWRGRQQSVRQGQAGEYRVWGGQYLLFATMLAGGLLTVFSFYRLWL